MLVYIRKIYTYLAAKIIKSMEGGLFLLLCLLALFIGSRARRSKTNINPKAIKQKARIKRFIVIVALILVTAFEIVYIPFLYQDIEIALHTHFSMDNYISVGIVIVGLIVIITSIKQLRKPLL